MPDYDVEAVALSSPPASAVVTPYRPAVSVRNNGVHDALASGYIRIYSAGLLIFTTEVYSGTIAPGATGLAQAVDYWTPPAEGKYIANGYVSCPLDQYEPNNNLDPSTFTVTGGPTPPPPTVPIHAAQHEEGGLDEVSIDGLKGRAADRQDALAHAASHQASGTDQINVSALIGELASPQTPKTHSNAYHDPVLVTESELSQHETASTAHSLATNLANRETTGDREGLVPLSQLALRSIVPEEGQDPTKFALRLDGFWGPTYSINGGGGEAASLGANAETVEAEPLATVTLIELEVPSAWNTDDMQFILKLCGYIHTLPSSGATLDLTLFLGDEELGVLQIPFAGASDRDFTIEAAILGRDPNGATGVMSWLASGLLPTDFELYQTNANALLSRMLGDTTIKIQAMHNNQNEGSLQSMTGYIRALHQPA
jgi:hypothetical protein